MSPSFEDVADEWLAWARTPGHDAYWYYREAFFALLPAPPTPAGAGPSAPLVLEIGCGEGRVARDLAARGYAVTAIDASPTLVAHAAERDPAGTYLVASAEDLPFPDGGFPLVVAYNSLMDVEALPRAVAEAARVLAPGGRLCVCVTHPVNDAIGASYLRGGAFSARETRHGLSMTFTGHRHSMEDYARALEAAGLVIEALREPAPSADASEHYERWRDTPMFLMLRAALVR
jgi:ubiquinone/menaquinone biosynthesis C-methylase UbiE